MLSLRHLSRGEEFFLKLSLDRRWSCRPWLMFCSSPFNSCTVKFMSHFPLLHINVWVFVARWSEAVKLRPSSQLGCFWQAWLCAYPRMVKRMHLVRFYTNTAPWIRNCMHFCCFKHTTDLLHGDDRCMFLLTSCESFNIIYCPHYH